MTPAARGVALAALGAGMASLVVGGGVALVGRFAADSSRLNGAAGETLFTLLIFGPLLLVAIVAARFGGRSALELGAAPARNAGQGLLLSLAGLSAAVLDARLAGTLTSGEGARAGVALLTGGAVVTLFQAASEEVFFRGWLQPALARCWPAWLALLGTSGAFAIAHLAGGERSAVALVNLLLGGILFGLLARRTGGIAASVAAHFGWNATEQLVFGLDPNPGVGSFGALLDRDLVGPALAGGSTQGLNGSLLMTFVLLAMLAPFALTRPPSPRPGEEFVPGA